MTRTTLDLANPSPRQPSPYTRIPTVQMDEISLESVVHSCGELHDAVEGAVGRNIEGECPLHCPAVADPQGELDTPLLPYLVHQILESFLF
ncbi:hypothetical protein AVEN_185968-1 [Araneus ventricosus]|uniref:Uncharacterized protein n=1 Tax=Araneus ventricosus TaxID=182803 RepID=A0A4Y2WP74_ARAVE|nr:hypothetical protein AVEN_185968-1 [Araneus ventricosus]